MKTEEVSLIPENPANVPDFNFSEKENERIVLGEKI